MGTVSSWEVLQILTASAERFQLCFLWPRARISGSCCYDTIATFIFKTSFPWIYFIFLNTKQ